MKYNIRIINEYEIVYIFFHLFNKDLWLEELRGFPLS